MFEKIKEKFTEKKDQFASKMQEIKDKQTEEKTPGIVKKRHRRTRAELEGAKVQIELREEGFEVIADFIKALSDRDVKVYHLNPVPKDSFFAISRSYAKIANYFIPKGKPIYLLIGITLFQTIGMFKHRADLINEKNPPKIKEQVPPEKKVERDKFPTRIDKQKV